MKRGAYLVAVGALLLLVGVAVACNGSDSGLKDRVTVLEQQVTQMNAASQNSSMVLALQALSAAGIHEFATSVDAGTLPLGESGAIQRALAAVAAAQWPSDLRTQAKDMQTKLSALLAALATDDIKQIKGPADAAHELNDTFPDAVYARLTGSLGLLRVAPAATQAPTGTPKP